mmetsp:Transcript_138429/g.442432  ORF Transcript_138429/g.442432 Transcript_138429/m.442432 type:complete len:227 (+) Transcript_138429:142-822(+)
MIVEPIFALYGDRHRFFRLPPGPAAARSELVRGPPAVGAQPRGSRLGARARALGRRRRRGDAGGGGCGGFGGAPNACDLEAYVVLELPPAMADQGLPLRHIRGELVGHVRGPLAHETLSLAILDFLGRAQAPATVGAPGEQEEPSERVGRRTLPSRLALQTLGQRLEAAVDVAEICKLTRGAANRQHRWRRRKNLLCFFAVLLHCLFSRQQLRLQLLLTLAFNLLL